MQKKYRKQTYVSVFLLCLFLISMLLIWKYNTSRTSTMSNAVIDLIQTADSNNSTNSYLANDTENLDITEVTNTADLQFQVSDKEQTWSKNTQINLFNKSKLAGDGQIGTVDSTVKTLAPGMYDTYTFELQNTGSDILDYELSVQSVLDTNGIDVDIPVELRILDKNQEYLAGDENTWILASQINYVVDTGTLENNSKNTYTIEWQWPYENSAYSNDELDTALGNLAVQSDLELTININVLVTAEINTTDKTDDTDATKDTETTDKSDSNKPNKEQGEDTSNTDTNNTNNDTNTTQEPTSSQSVANDTNKNTTDTLHNAEESTPEKILGVLTSVYMNYLAYSITFILAIILCAMLLRNLWKKQH